MGNMEIEFGRRLGRILSEKGLNQVELAEKVGVSHASVNRWIAGKDFPRYGKLKKLIRILGVTPTELLGDFPSVSIVQADIKPLDKEQFLAALEKEGLPPEVIEIIRRLHGDKLEPWQVEAIDAIIKGGKKKEE